MLSAESLDLAGRVLVAYRRRGLRLATAESCTGGLLGAALTALPGASDVLERGFITYANTAKTDLLGVAPALLDRAGAVSDPVARAMADGALARAPVAAAVAITGVAGPGGGSAEKPVGLVCFGLARQDGETVGCRRIFEGDRAAIRAQSVDLALDLLLAAAGEGSWPAT